MAHEDRGEDMADTVSAARYGIEVEHLLLHVKARIRKAGCAEKIDAEQWLMNWLITPNGAFGGACPQVFLHTSVSKPDRNVD